MRVAVSTVFVLLQLLFVLSEAFCWGSKATLLRRLASFSLLPPPTAQNLVDLRDGQLVAGGRGLSTALHSAAESSSTESGVSAKDRLSQLNDAICEFNSTAAKELLSELTAMRQGGTDPSSSVEGVLNELLAEGPDRRLPLWSRTIRPLTRYSNRARLASLRRTLDLTTPPPNLDDGEMDDPDDQQRRRRRALVSLLRTLAAPAEEEEEEGQQERGGGGGVPAIVRIEKRARRELSAGRKKEDMILRRPSDLETPEYAVLAERSGPGYEIRQYQPFSICTVSMRKPRPDDMERTDAAVSDSKMGGARAFGALAGYLFGKNKQKEAMKMTTPVLTNERGDDKLMSFVLPSKFWTEKDLSKAPEPLDGSGVELELNQGGERAVTMFGGFASKADVEKRKKKLLEALKRDKEWEAVESETPVLAQYNDPFTPPWKRLNEVSVAVRPRSSS